MSNETQQAYCKVHLEEKIHKTRNKSFERENNVWAVGGGIRPSEFHGRISCLGNYVIIKVAFPTSGERMNYSINHSGTVAIHQEQKHSSHQILKFPINSILNLIHKCTKLENCLKFFIFEQNDSN